MYKGVSQYPSHEGRFLQVSGLKFAFDPSKPSGNRVDPRLITVGDAFLDLEKVKLNNSINYSACHCFCYRKYSKLSP
jgi:hypothetical protein